MGSPKVNNLRLHVRFFLILKTNKFLLVRLNYKKKINMILNCLVCNFTKFLTIIAKRKSFCKLNPFNVTREKND